MGFRSIVYVPNMSALHCFGTSVGILYWEVDTTPVTHVTGPRTIENPYIRVFRCLLRFSLRLKDLGQYWQLKTSFEASGALCGDSETGSIPSGGEREWLT